MKNYNELLSNTIQFLDAFFISSGLDKSNREKNLIKFLLICQQDQINSLSKNSVNKVAESVQQNPNDQLSSEQIVEKLLTTTENTSTEEVTQIKIASLKSTLESFYATLKPTISSDPISQQNYDALLSQFPQ